jgi:uncharacterized protein YjbJ (UPF0337 family)
MIESKESGGKVIGDAKLQAEGAAERAAGDQATLGSDKPNHLIWDPRP